jgi:DNA-binding beta-propeller fold protein YncE
MRYPAIIFILIVFISCLGLSCERQPVDLGDGDFKFDRGVFIVNEGQFLAANASISFYDTEKDSVYKHIFYQANQVPLGDVAHSMIIWQDDAYIVVNNSGKIYRVNRYDMEYKGKMTGLSSPRYIAIVNTDQMNPKAYISDLYSGNIIITDPIEGTVLDSIDIRGSADRFSSEQMILHNGKLYIACWSYSRQVLVIDTETDRLLDSIELGKQPNSMVVDKHGYLWVLSDGGYPFSPYGQEKASLARVNLETHTVETMKTWDDIRVSPTDLCINHRGDSLYFISEGVYKVSLDMQGFDKALITENGRHIYSLGVDPSDGRVYVGDAVDYQQDGWVYRYSAAGSAIDSFRVGVNPGYFCFSTARQQ